MTTLHRLLAAMFAAGRGYYVSGWIEFAQRDEALSSALKAVFGKKFPTPQKFGQWLAEHIGPHGKYRLAGQHSLKHKAWAYRVFDAEAEKAQADAEAQRQAVIRSELEKQAAIAREAAARRDAELVAKYAPKSEPQDGDVVTDPDGQRYLIGKRRYDEQGRVTQEKTPLPPKSEAPSGATRVDPPSFVALNVRGRDLHLSGLWYSEAKRPGFDYAARLHEPGKYHPRFVFIPTPPEAQLPEDIDGAPPWMGRNASGTPVLKRQPTREELAARHSQYEAPACSDRNGIDWFKRACEARRQGAI